MNKYLAAFTVGALWAVPAHSTGGLVCRTAGAKPIQVSLAMGHVAGAPLVGTRLMDAGRDVPVRAAQWWLDDKEARVLLTDPNAGRQEVLIRVRRNGRVYDGSLWRNGMQRWVRCREG